MTTTTNIFWLRFGGGLVRVDSLEAASSTFTTMIDNEGYGASDLLPHDGEVESDGGEGPAGVVVARIAYNGRIIRK